MTSNEESPLQEHNIDMEINYVDKRRHRKKLQNDLCKEFSARLSTKCLTDFETLLTDDRLKELEDLLVVMEKWDVNRISDVTDSFLNRTGLKKLLETMLDDIAKYSAYLKPFIEKFDAKNERCKHSNAPIHYAVEQLNQDFLEWLFEEPKDELLKPLKSPDVNLRNDRKQTALMKLCNRYHETTHEPNEEINKLITFLLEKNADFNICCSELKLPFALLFEHGSHNERMRDFVKDCASKALSQPVKWKDKDKSLVEFHDNNDKPILYSVELLEIFMCYKDLINFKSCLEEFPIDENNVKKVIELLMLKACEKQLFEYMDLIIVKGHELIFQVKCERFYKYHEELKVFLRKVCIAPHIETFKYLKSKFPGLLLKQELLLLELVKQYRHQSTKGDCKVLMDCIMYLAKTGTIDILKANNSGNTGLHLAVKYNLDDLARKLLNLPEAFVGIQDNGNLTPLSYSSYEFWESYLDSCVVGQNNTKDKWFSVDLNGFKPPGRAAEKESTEGNDKPMANVNEMTSLCQIAQSENLNRLLLHPVLYTFIMVKWKKLRIWNYLRLALTICTIISFAAYCHSVSFSFGQFQGVFRILSFICFFCMIGIYIVQVFYLQEQKHRAFKNLLRIMNIVAMIWILGWEHDTLVVSFLIISLSMQFTVLLYTLNANLGTTIHMFQTISINFLRSILLFTPLLAAFSYSFYVMYNHRPISNNSTGNHDQPEDDFNSFSPPLHAIIKTLVMMTGEFDAASLNLDGRKVLLFLVFIFFIPIVILNLINGLAVSDITAIRKESEVISISRKVLKLERYCVASIRSNWLGCLFPKPFFVGHDSHIDVHKENCEVVVYPFKKVRSELPKNRWCIWMNKMYKRYTLSTLDPVVVKHALSIIDNRQDSRCKAMND